MKQMQIMVLIIAAFFLLSNGPVAMAADKPAPAPAITDEVLALQAQMLTEKAGRLEAEYRLTVGELGKVRAEIQKRAAEKKAKDKK